MCFFLHFLQLKNVDFDGLFGNIGSVIDLSQRLLGSLQETDNTGKKPLYHCLFYPQSNQASSFYMLYFALYQHGNHKLPPDNY